MEDTMIHKDICIKFEVDGRQYEAVGFLNEDESSVDGHTMLSRTAGENGGAIGDDDETFLKERRDKFPEELRKYYLATGRRNPDDPCVVSYFIWCSGRWCQYWDGLGSRWRGFVLVLRRCT